MGSRKYINKIILFHYKNKFDGSAQHLKHIEVLRVKKGQESLKFG